MSEPETLPLIMALIGWCLVMCLLAWVSDRKARRRNRWIDPPRPDERDSIQTFRRINRP